ncbi:multiple monosaccharide ABC transporter ATP-binding protein [Paracoccus aminovorans]|uniref:Multiple monosaccharide ABC transporter ATP-binding protein n=1 Tax=Paracoccus aminovorans TaxID=34004 RepID=A0A1I3B5N2_9RHOB|nr:multiple monosaccharide ABC transporter ATP-binding protein [Paracoccus aminovorans]CQR87524.1 D-xylose ABC transporter, ATP-binding protein [Paracoccus aminovorans]SFH57615.1 multiple monosaccharide ABC transporter ATP-binding protein [Paracoccus aminovorans]
MDAILEMRGITKEFPGVKALDNVNMTVRRGEIRALVGENGAGKSTLMKVLSGVYPHGSYQGEILYNGQPMANRSIKDSEEKGIVIIHQELALVPQMSIAENIFLGNEIATRGIIDRQETNRRTAELLAKVGLRESPETKVGSLGMGKQQLIEIAKALSKKVDLLILDEPTSSLNEHDSDALLRLLAGFRDQGMTAILISHKLNEISQVCDSITVLRDGSTVAHHDGMVAESQIVRDMVGRAMDDRYPSREPKIGEVVMQVRDWSVADPLREGRLLVKKASFELRQGEVLGIAGLMGAGRTELAMSIFGRSMGDWKSGSVRIHGREVELTTVPRAIAAGLAYVTEDRKSLGLVLEDTIRRNIPLANLAGISTRGVVDRQREGAVARDYRKRINIRSPSVEQKTVNLSGGNQQKVVLAKWLFSEPEILILDEPTRGIDVGAKYEIYTIIRDLAASGKSIIVISSEMPELLGITDRILVMNEGRLVGELRTAEATQEKIMSIIIRSGHDLTDEAVTPEQIEAEAAHV